MFYHVQLDNVSNFVSQKFFLQEFIFFPSIFVFSFVLFCFMNLGAIEI